MDGGEYKGMDNADILYYVKIDLKDNFPDRKSSEFKVVSRQFLIKNGVDPTDTNNWIKY